MERRTRSGNLLDNIMNYGRQPAPQPQYGVALGGARQVGWVPNPAAQPRFTAPPPAPAEEEDEGGICTCGRCFGGPVRCSTFSDFNKPDHVYCNDPGQKELDDAAEIMATIPRDDYALIENERLARESAEQDLIFAQEVEAARIRTAQAAAAPYQQLAVERAAKALTDVAQMFAKDHPESR